MFLFGILIVLALIIYLAAAIDERHRQEAEKEQARLREMQAKLRDKIINERPQLEKYGDDIFQDIYSNMLIGVITGGKAIEYAKYKVTYRAAAQSLATIVKLIENLSKANASIKNDPGNQALQRLIVKTRSDALGEINLLLHNLAYNQENSSLEEANRMVQLMLRELTIR
jgi:hypothetical protein